MKNLKKLAASLAAFTTALSLSVGTLSVTANEIKKDIDKTFAEKAFVATFKDAKYKDAAKYLVDNGISLDDAKDIMTLYIEGDKEERPIKKVSSVKGAANTSTPPKPFYAKNYISDQQHYGVIIANRGDVYDDNVNFYLEYNRKLKESDPEPVINLGKVSNSDINSLNTAVTGLGCYFGPDVLIYCLDIWANIDMKSSADKITNICDFPIELKTKNTTEEKVRQAITFDVSTGNNCTVPVEYSFETYICGDVNHDGKVNSRDLTELLNYNLSGGEFPTKFTGVEDYVAKAVQQVAGDLDRNGYTELSDIIVLENILKTKK